MKILLTGASSFTGYWFSESLSRLQHDVSGTFRGVLEDYKDERLKRTTRFDKVGTAHWNTTFGDASFIGLLDQSFDVLCLHAAEMENYRSWDFDPVAATAANTRNIRDVFETFQKKGGQTVIVTGSVFEPFEGIGDIGNKAFNPYGLSKHLSFEIMRMEAERLDLKIGKFVIPNPFGPLEEFKFTSYLCREWSQGNTPSVATPDYIRDNIPVTLLAESYAKFVTEFHATSEAFSCLKPSGYIESQGMFANRFAKELGSRIGRTLNVDWGVQKEFTEPRIRTNNLPAAAYIQDWKESEFWDAVASYSVEKFAFGVKK